MRRLLSATALLLASLPATFTLTVPAEASVASPASPAGGDTPLRFIPDATLELGQDAATVTLANYTNQPWALDLRAQVVSKSAPNELVAIPVRASRNSIAPNGEVIVWIGPPDSGRISGGRGFVAVTARSRGQTSIVRLPLSYSPMTSTAAVTEWLGVSTAEVPWASTSRLDLPLIPLEGKTCGSNTSGETFVTTGTRSAKMTYSCNETSDGPMLSLKPDDSLSVGEYTGSLQIGEADVKLTFRRTTLWAWPLLVILLGFVLATIERAWVNNQRPMRRARARLTALGNVAIQKQMEYDRLASGATYRRYTFTIGVARKVAVLQGELDKALPGWSRRWFLPVAVEEQQKAYDAVVKEMVDVDATITSWPSLAAGFDELRGVLSASEPLADLAPELLSSARSLLDPANGDDLEVQLTYEEARRLLDQVPKTTAALRLLPLAKELAEQLPGLQPDGSRQSDFDVYERAYRLLNQAEAELAMAADSSDVENGHVQGLLSEARSLALQLRPAAPVKLEAAVAGEITYLARPVAWLGRVLAAFSTSAGHVRAVDFTWLVIATALGAWTGLATLYFGKAWGTPSDYIALLAWAIAAAVVLTPILAALERVASGPLQLGESGAAADQAKV